MRITTYKHEFYNNTNLSLAKLNLPLNTKNLPFVK